MKPCKTKEIAGKRYHCFFELTLMAIGGKWKPVVLYRLGRERIRRFSDLRRDIPEVTERMLSRQSRELEQDGLIHREVYRQVPPKVEYPLTKLGCGLIPILLSMRECARYRERFRKKSLRHEGFPARGSSGHFPPVSLNVPAIISREASASSAGTAISRDKARAMASPFARGTRKTSCSTFFGMLDTSSSPTTLRPRNERSTGLPGLDAPRKVVFT
ncbi:transcriptional regulator, HxlR family [Syntrophobacter fumaroxidans MPOB]|uniref:Transcriptional regulator, HxlR family n=1 Tax=Syntrophobacter fumaroxidans (strain DSM 10017 / MPOB) TaxID=335543 RepID=A0LGN6_SYNFM|nr:transcriptional regulator, HxlR family [Syntrophobacter fumaroxidans MPOB]